MDPRLSTIGCASPSFWCCLELRAHVLIPIGEDGAGPQVVKGSTQSKIVKNVLLAAFLNLTAYVDSWCFFFFLVCQRLVVPVRRTARLHCERRERECAMRKREVRCVLRGQR